MRAALFHQHGGPDVLRIEEIPIPEPGPGEVRVAVAAAAMNHLDLWVRRGLPIDIPLPHVGGSDIAGVVDAVGPGVEVETGVRVVVDPSLGYGWYDGEPAGPGLPERSFRLIGEHTDGGFAEYVVVPAANLLALPDEVDFETAAAAALTFVTAWRGLHGRARVRSGERVLVTGGSGGVATAGIQLAKLAGCVVHVVTSGSESVERVRGLGARHAYDRLSEDWVAALRKDAGGSGVDVVLDSVGGPLWTGMLRSLGVGGRLVSYGATGGPGVEVDLRHLFWKQLSILGTTMGTPAEFRAVMRRVFDGAVAPVIHRTLPLDEIRTAHELLEAGEVFGKLVIIP